MEQNMRSESIRVVIPWLFHDTISNFMVGAGDGDGIGRLVDDGDIDRTR